jgi:hypothetical protein
MTALSAVGAAFSAGAAAVCAPAAELNASTPASVTMAISGPLLRPIAISFSRRLIAGLSWAVIIAGSLRL